MHTLIRNGFIHGFVCAFSIDSPMESEWINAWIQSGSKGFRHGEMKSEWIQNGFTHGYTIDSYMGSELFKYGIITESYLDS